MWKLIRFVLVLAVVTGCSRQHTKPDGVNTDLVYQFAFDSADNIKRGDRVMFRGITVGEVTAEPQIAEDGDSVVISARLNRFPESNYTLLSQAMTATVGKDSAVVGNTVLRLDFGTKPADNSGLITGCNNKIEKKLWDFVNKNLPEQPGTSAVDRLVSTVFPVDKELTGVLVYWVNTVLFFSTFLVILAVILDKMRQLAFDRQREKRAPGVFRWAFIVFTLLAGLKLVFLVAVGLFAILGISPPQLAPLLVIPESPVIVLRQDYIFAIIAIAVFYGKFGLKAIPLTAGLRTAI